MSLHPDTTSTTLLIVLGVAIPQNIGSYISTDARGLIASLTGSGGPLKVSYGGKFTNVGQQYLDVASKFDTERGPNTAEGENVDPNDLVTVNKYGVRRPS